MSAATIALRDFRTFHVGGEIVELSGQEKQIVQVSPDSAPRTVDLNGRYVTGQLYAQHFMLEKPRRQNPILFWHGGAMSGVTWETTPDGREGWMMQFLRAGHDVVVSDAVERGRSSWSPYPQIYKTPPLFRTQEDAWSLFRMGLPEGFDADPAKRKPYQPTRFPVASFDMLCTQFVPRWTSNVQQSVDAYLELIAKFERPIIVAHSQGGWFAQKIASLAGNQIAALVMLEPAGAPAMESVAVARAAQVPHLYVWGDNCNDHPAWKPYKGDAFAHAKQLQQAGGTAQHIDLPEMGIFGNSHLPMMDDNCAEIAKLCREWIEANT